MTPKILLVTTVTWPSAARLAGAFATLGACVEAVAPRHHVLAVSRYPGHVHRYAPLAPHASIANAIRAAAPDTVIPCDDRALALLLSLPESDALLRRSLGPLESYATLTTRSASIAAACEEGIAAPLTLSVPHAASLAQALERVGLPCVMKTDASWGGGGVRVVRDLAEAEQAYAALKGPPARWRSVCRAVLRKDAHFIADAITPRAARVSVQAFVPGRPATSVFAARDGIVLAALHMDVVSWEGATGPARSMQRVECAKMDEAARRIAARFRLNGFHGLDFVRDAAGVPHLIEINPRATQICHLALGADLPAALYGLPSRPAVTDKTLIALFPQLLTVAQHDAAVYEDVPWDDPAVLHSALEPFGEGSDRLCEFEAPADALPVLRGFVEPSPGH